MRNKLVITINFLLFNTFFGCASLDSVSYFKNDIYTDRSGWKEGPEYYNYSAMPFTIYWNNYIEKEFSIYLTPRPYLGHSLALGFSYVPVMIPNIFSITYNLISPENDSLTFEALINSSNSEIEIDLSKVLFKVNEEDIFPDRIYCSKITADTLCYKEYVRSPKYFGSKIQNIYNYTTGLIKLNNESLYIIFKLPIKKIDVDKINISFDQVISEIENHKINSLILLKEIQYIYDPTIFMRALSH
ncbi:MAG: hypothetical protein IPH11_17120 [Ignavibacteriales bacterium]|nr:hypothetical protein [Ignavibacteriales bacterium]